MPNIFADAINFFKYRSPFLCLACKETNLAGFPAKSNEKGEIISLFSIAFGTRMYYFFVIKNFRIRTLNIGNFFNAIFNKYERKLYDFSWMYSLKMEDNYRYLNENAKANCDEYKKRLDNLESDDDHAFDIEKDYLAYKINQEISRIDVASNKTATYLKILTFLYPIIFGNIYYIIKEKVLDNNGIKFFTIISVIFIYVLLNILLLLYENIQVKGLNQSTFSDLKKSHNKQMASLYNYYYDWQYKKADADYRIFCVSMLQYWTIMLLLLSIIFFIVSVFYLLKCNTN